MPCSNSKTWSSDAESTTLIQLALSVPTGVAASLVAAWLYDKLGKGGSPRKLRINRTEIHFDKGRIEKFIKERIESEK